MSAVTEAALQAALKTVVDPHTGKDFVSTRGIKNLKVDGDELTLSAACQAPGAVRIALGSCTGRVLAAHPVN